jgi:hypothetical protein
MRTLLRVVVLIFSLGMILWIIYSVNNSGGQIQK